MNTPRPPRKGFTLIELLIVIAIIGILASILFPVFARARENARRASCQSNLKQLGLAVSQYTQDSDERYPVTEYGRGANPPVYVLERLAPYVKHDQIFRCPTSSTTETSPGAFLMLSTSGGGMILCDYFPTLDIGDDPSAAARSPGRWGIFGLAVLSSGVPLSDVPVPAETICITERADVSDGVASSTALLDSYSITPTSGSNARAAGEVTLRHFNGANYLFCDGHVKWFPRRRATLDGVGANATINGVNYYYFWRKGVTGKQD